MDAYTWHTAKAILAAVADLSPAEQRAYVERHCADLALRAELLSLLESPALLSDVLLRAPALTAGTRIGSYEIESVIGAGGMGEVYKAWDTRLHRNVAIKVLPFSLATDRLRLAMLEREARMLAALNHSGIAQIFGIEESTDVPALVMEFVEGPTLAERIRRGALSVEESLAVAGQIADALEAAHERGIVHRDLKPANIKVRADGTVKLLDFGLAKALDAAPSATAASTHDRFIVGTAAYMSPEQASGKPVDGRTDIWAFGCVLYEMISGKRAFAGQSAADVMSEVLTHEADLSVLPPVIPRSARMCVQRCLEKDVRRRIQAIGDARLLLEGAFDDPSQGLPWRATRRLPWAVAVILALTIVGLMAWAGRGAGKPPLSPERRFAISVPAPVPLPYGTLVALSPDGQTLVYRSVEGGVPRLYQRRLDQLQTTPIAGTERVAADAAFFSPDGQWLGFVIDRRLWRVPIAGGPPQAIAALGNQVTGAWWERDDSIICGTDTAGLLRVRATGGTPETLAAPSDTHHLWYPQLLPGGDAVLFSSSHAAPNSSDVVVLDLKSGQQRRLVPGVLGQYLPTGHLVFVRENTLWAVRFDLRRLETQGDPVAIEHGVFTHAGGRLQLAIAPDGTLAYVSRPAAYHRRTLEWVDRLTGREEPTGMPPHLYRFFQLSPDQTRILIEVFENENDVWMWDVRRPFLQRLTHDEGRIPVWSPDGAHIVYWSAGELYTRATDGSGDRRRITHDLKQSVAPFGFAPNGKDLLVYPIYSGKDINILSLSGTEPPRPLLSTPFEDGDAAVSANGRWLAYVSNVSDTREVYVREFDRPGGGAVRISSGGGRHPRWRADGRELFYRRQDGSIVAVPVTNDRTFEINRATVALRTTRAADLTPRAPYDGGEYEVSRDGRRFLVMKELDDEKSTAPIEIVVVLNWFEKVNQAFASRR